MAVINFIIANKVVILGTALAISEALALIPSIKANSIFQSVVNVIKFLKEKMSA